MSRSDPFAELPPPAQRRRSEFWSKLGGGSLTVSILLHAIILAIGAYWIFQVIRVPEKQVDFMPAGGGGGKRDAKYDVQMRPQPLVTPDTNVKRVFAEGVAAQFSLPDQADAFGEMQPLTALPGGGLSGGLGSSGLGGGFGKGGKGDGMGDGLGMGKLFGLIPETMRKRCTKQNRLQRLAENGGTPACEDAVVNGLLWLKNNQNPDGSWDGQSKVAATGLALLAYFGHCETPVSPEFGESCTRAITYLVNVGLATDGKMVNGAPVAAPPRAVNGDDHGSNPRESNREREKREQRERQVQLDLEARSKARFANMRVEPYTHAIATYALGEACVFCKEVKVEIPSLREVTLKAGQFIIDRQHRSSGGWDYNYDIEGPRGGDVSIVGWQLQALKACSHARLGFKV
jgi:hypothetical protein